MRNIIFLFSFILLSACGSGGSDNKPTPEQPSSDNKSPTISISGEQQAVSAQAIRLSTQIDDPEGESVTMEWSSNLAGVTFQDASEAGVLIQLPNITESQQIVVTLKVTDSAKNTVSKSFTISVEPSQTNAEIELKEHYEFLSGSIVKVTAKFMAQEKVEQVDWQLTNLTVDDMNISSNSVSGSGESTVSFTAPDVSESQSYLLDFILDTTAGRAEKQTTIKILPKNSGELIVNLDASYQGNENDQMLIKPEVQTSEVVESYQWQWLDDSLGELVGQSSKNVIIKTADVSDDQTATLVLTVKTRSGKEKSVQTEIKVKNVVQSGNVSLSVNRTYAAPGQEVVVKVQLDNPDDIKSFEWQVSDEVYTDITESASQLNLVMPTQSTSLLSTLVNYKVTFKNDVSVEKQAVFTLMSESATKATLDITQADELPQLYKNEKLTFNAQAIDKAGVLDSVTLDTSSISFAELNIATLTRDGLDMTFTLQAENILVNAELMLKVVMNAGTVSAIEYVKVKLNRSNLKLFAGSEKTFLSGSDFYVFGHAQDRLNSQNIEMNWSSNNDDLSIESLSANAAKITNNATASYLILTLSALDDEGTRVQSDVVTKMTSRIYESGDTYNCYFRTDEVSCRDKRSNKLDTGEITDTIKKGVTDGEYACLLTNTGIVSCHGNGPASVLEVPERANAVNIVAVNNTNMCAQYTSGEWQCWGESQSTLNTLLADKPQVDNLIGTNNGVCLVNQGYFDCYDEQNKPIFKDTSSFVKSIEYVTLLKKVCYIRQDSSLRQCPDDINAAQ